MSTIMVIGEDDELSDVLQYNLRRANYDVRASTDGREAMDAVREEPPDLILLDIMLPGADGWEICRTLEADPQLRRIPIIVFTARGSREDFDKARQFKNFAGFFIKPYATADVLKHVEKVLAQTGA